ncbi:20542_t:CDS:2 [Entrophospora sp. SA101]|nr:20542_t:CDS:2 [Entrophospora sp. SA101]CAJ0903372.1 4817_t:CDS:2 [Entrophospora sp. SA101]
MWEILGIENKDSLHKIVEKVIREAMMNTLQWKFEQFIKTATWKLNKNLHVHCFIDQMKKVCKNKIPGPGDRFSFVVTKAKMDFDLHDLLCMGKRCEPPSSDKITQIRDSDEKYKQIDTYAQTRPRSGSSHILKEINVINGFIPQMIVAH